MAEDARAMRSGLRVVPKIDHEIDRLYQAPLAGFTPARDELAKRLGAGYAHLKRLQKPNVAAWAVNQLYWKQRDAYDRLVKAADALRAAHKKVLAGKSADLKTSETSHRDAVRVAADQTRRILAAAGETASPQTLTAIAETLEALPGPDEPGRLTRPLKRLGFEALAGVKLSPARARAAEPRPEPPKEKRELARMAQRLRDARASERQEEGTLKRAEAAVLRAEREEAEIEERRRKAAETVRRLRTEVSRQKEAYDAAVAERERLERQLK